MINLHTTKVTCAVVGRAAILRFKKIIVSLPNNTCYTINDAEFILLLKWHIIQMISLSEVNTDVRHLKLNKNLSMVVALWVWLLCRHFPPFLCYNRGNIL